jgi:hypothetical protein
MRALVACVLLLACKSEDPGIRGDRADPVPAKTSPLVGRWKAEGSGRELEARERNGVVTFHVVDPEQWNGAYAADEIRFSIREGSAGLLVTDRYRPFDLHPGVHYGESGRAACLSELTGDDQGHPLRAVLTDVLAVDFAHVEQTVEPGDGSLEVVSCGAPRVIGVLHRTLRRAKSP